MIKSISLFMGNHMRGIKKLFISFEDNKMFIKENCFEKKIENGYIDDENIINDFLDRFNEINIKGWNSKYHPLSPSIDPTAWELFIKFDDSDNEIIIEGCDNYPQDFELLIKLLMNFTNLYNDGYRAW